MEEENFYEDMLNDHDLKKGFKHMKIVVLFFVLILVGFGIYITYLKLTQKEKVEEVKEDIVKNITISEEINLEEEIDNSSFKVGDSDISISYHNNEGKKTLTLNHQTILDQTYECGGPVSLYVVENTILLTEHNGCLSGGNKLYMFDEDINLIKTYEYFDKGNNMWMETPEISILKDSIHFTITGLYEEHTLRLNDLEEVNLCIEDEYETYEISYDTPVKMECYIHYKDGHYEEEYKVIKTVKEDIVSCK